MPVTNTQQARIELSRAQAKKIAGIIDSSTSESYAIEETNIPNVVAVQTKARLQLVHHNGDIYNLGAAAAQAKKRVPRQGRPR